MSQDDFDAEQGIAHTTTTTSHEHEHEVEEALEEALELDTQSQIFLEMRRQNLDLLRIATQVAGYTGSTRPAQAGRPEEGAAQHLGRLLRVLHLDRSRGSRGRQTIRGRR